VDAERLRDLFDGHVGVIARADVDPAVPLVDCAALRADADLDPLGGVDEVEVLEVTVVTEDGVALSGFPGQGF
jgi:hypothetical protein